MSLDREYDDTPLVVSKKRYIAYNHFERGSFVLWKMVFEVSENR